MHQELSTAQENQKIISIQKRLIMKLSIITPCFNAEKYIYATALSVISQQGDFEIDYFIIDGNSTDKTLEKIKQIEALTKLRSFQDNCKGITFNYISEADRGMYHAISKGLEAATGDIIAYINASDGYLPGAFQAVANTFRNHQHVNWLTGWNTWAKESGELFDNFLPVSYSESCIKSYQYNGHLLPHIQQESTFWRKHLLENIETKILSKMKYAGDFYLWKTYCNDHKLHILQAQLAFFKLHENQKSTDIELYHTEARSISNKATLPVLLLKLLQAILSTLPNRLKSRLSNSLIKPL